MPAARLEASILAGPFTNTANGHLYYLLNSNSWTAAEAEAVALGGHLVTLNDAGENQWVHTNFITHGGGQRPLWIGLTDRQAEGVWRWASGEPVTFTNWLPGEPNNNTNRGPQNWAMLWPPVVPIGSSQPGKWNDYWDSPTVLDPGLTNLMLGLYGVVEVTPGQPVHFVDFEAGPGPGWSATNISTTPIGGRKFLGEFGNQTVTLTLSNLPPHTDVRVMCDLFVVRSWDGNDSEFGPDLWQFRVDGGRESFVTTFNNFLPSHPGNGPLRAAAGQSYPFEFAGTNVNVYPSLTGAIETNTLGYLAGGSSIPPPGIPLDTVYRVSRLFPHSSGELKVHFQASGLQALSDEAWGLDNVRVELIGTGSGSGTNFVWIPSGTFTMGWAPGESVGGASGLPRTQVTLTAGFWMGKYEVTAGEFQSCMGYNPSFFTSDLAFPVHRVSWEEASDYCARLNHLELAAGRLPSGYSYRLPTEAEWEYACRAGSTTSFSFGENDADLPAFAWTAMNSGNTPHPVGTKLPNSWGLFDMHGNAWEWCLEPFFSTYPGGEVVNWHGAMSGSLRVFRGGAWNIDANGSHSSVRGNITETNAWNTGFRVVLASTLPPFPIQSAGGMAEDVASGIAADNRGNVFVTGHFQGTIGFGGTNLNSAGTNDVFLAKYNAAGALLWARAWGGTGDDVGHAVSVDGEGNAYVAGTFQGSAAFGPTNLISVTSYASFIAKYDPFGNLLWAVRLGGSASAQMAEIAVHTGSVLVTGAFEGTGTFSSTNLVSSGSTDPFVAKLSPDGSVIWVRRGAGPGPGESRGVTVGSAGEVFIVGRYQGALTIGSTTLSAAGDNDAFVAKYDAGGNALWARTVGGTQGDSAGGVVVGDSGDVFVTGLFRDTASFGLSNLISNGGSDLFIAKYTLDGAVAWVRRVGGVGNDSGLAIALNVAGEPLVSGAIENSVESLSGVMVSRGGTDIYWGHFTSGGDPVWAESGGGTGPDHGRAITVDAFGRILLAGLFNDVATLGTNIFTSVAGSDVFVAEVFEGMASVRTLPLVTQRAVWKYLDDGSDRGTSWAAPGFDDSPWPSGPAQLGYSSNPPENDEATVVGYGPNPSAKYITTYFRRTFVVSNAWAITNLTLGLLRDDGGIVYLNGVEVFRSNLPQGPVNSLTLASNAVDDGTVFVGASVSSGFLVEGGNLLAVEIHQASVSSTDLSFDLQFDAHVSASHPSLLTLTNPAGTLVLERAAIAVAEDGGTAAIQVRRLGGSAGSVSVGFEKISGTATGGVDFNSTPGSLIFADGETLKTLGIPIVNDSLPENNEAFVVRLLSPPGGATLDGCTHLTVTILDDDGYVEFVRTNYVLSEMDAGFWVGLRWTGNTSQPVSVRLRSVDESAIGGGIDHYSWDGTITFLPGVAQTNVFVNLRDNALPEADETFRLELSGLTAGVNTNERSRASVLILDDDASTAAGRGVNWQAQALVVQPDGKVLVGGGFNSAGGAAFSSIARFQPDALVDLSFAPAPGANSWVESIALQADGNVLIGGHFVQVNNTNRVRVARLNANGSVDTSFAPTTGANAAVYEILSTQTSKALIAGNFTSVNGTSRNRIARLNTDGSLDLTFNPGTGPANPPAGTGYQPIIWALTEQADGRIVVSGEFATFNGASRNYITRLNSDGSLDHTFTPSLNGICNTLQILPDGRILLGGWFSTVNGVTRNRVAILSSSGTLDTTFNPGTGPDASPWSIARQADGKLLVAGYYQNWNGVYRGGLVRLNTNGTLDATFNIGPGGNGNVNAVGVLPDGRIAAAGEFSVFNGHARSRFVILNPDGSQDPEPVRWTQWPAAAGGDNHWYALTSQPGSWTNAENEALNYSGHLVSVNSAAEQTFLESAFLQGLNGRRPLWIGFHDASNEGTYVWSSGEPVTFTDWQMGEPFDAGTEDFAALNWQYSHFLGDYINTSQGVARRGSWNDCPVNGTPYVTPSLGPYFGIMETPNPPFATFSPSNRVSIPAGSFVMGAVANEPVSVPNEDPQTQVTLTQSFWINPYETTQGEFQALMGYNPSHFTGDAQRPVEQVSWLEAMEYCSRLTQRERAAGRIPGDYGYRLPTEAEWEYACRAGTTSYFSFGANPSLLGSHGWHYGNSGCHPATNDCSLGSTRPVGLKLPNPWGLYDMHGNVGELVLDWSGNYPGGSATDPLGPLAGINKIFRAPGWDFGDVWAGSAIRWDFPPGARDDSIGFRVVLAAYDNDHWIAFNDFAVGPGTHPNTTSIHVFTNQSGALRDIRFGVSLPVRLTVEHFGVTGTGSSTNPAAGTPAYHVFNGYVDFSSPNTTANQSIELDGSDVVRYTFAGLDPWRRYSFIGSANRGEPSYTNRWALVELEGARAFSASHSAGVLTSLQTPALASAQAALNTGANLAKGDYVGWAGIQPDASGRFVVVCRQYTGPVPGGSASGVRAYALTGLRLAVENAAGEPPVFVQQPASTGATINSTMALRSLAFGTGPISYLWEFNGVAIPGATSSSLALAGVQPAVGGAYRVVVANAYGWATSGVATLTVNVPPVVTQHPQGQTVQAGAQVALGVAASGSVPMGFRLLKGSLTVASVVLPVNSHTFLLSNVQPADSGTYRILLTNAAHSAPGVASAAAVVTVLAPAAVTAQPTNVAAAVGGSATFCVTATGSAPLRYQWRHNGANIAGATNACLSLTNVQLADGGAYQVVIENGAGTLASDTALLVIAAPAAPAPDPFTNRFALTGASGSIGVTNVGATKEPGEPNHAGKPGGASVWYGWTAPAGGIATFRTLGSTFDTLLAVYTGTNVANLTPVASDEDDGGFFTSLVQFNTIAGTEYAIALDGFGGAEGSFILSWSLENTAEVLPVITHPPASRTVSLGASTTLTVGASGNGLRYQWHFHGGALLNQTNPTLNLANVQAAHVGSYFAAVTNNQGRGLHSDVAVVEIGPVPSVQSQDKFADLFLGGGGFAPAATGGGFISVSVGTTTAPQIINNTGSSTQSGEADHCIVISTATRWLRYRAENAGVLILDTQGSGIPTVVEVYSALNLLGLPTGSVACGKTNALDGRSSVVSFAAVAGKEYYVAADGFRGAVGIIQLNARLGQAPALPTPNPTNAVVDAGDGIQLNAPEPLNGSSGLRYQWRLDGRDIVGATGASYQLSGADAANGGTYTVVVYNDYGQAIYTVGGVTVQLNYLRAEPQLSNGRLRLWVQRPVNGAVVIEASDALGAWTPLHTVPWTAPGPLIDVPVSPADPRFYRARPWP